MKKIRLILLAMACLVMPTICLADDRPIPVEQLPAAAKTFVQEHFAGQKIIYAEVDGRKFEVRLGDGTKIEFDKKGTWDKVDCQMNAVPEALIPDSIAQYVSGTFPNDVIVKIDKERYGYEIELSNDIDMKFDKQGTIIGMDD